MYSADYAGRIWLDKDTFLAPFGHFDADYRFVINFLRDQRVSDNTYHDGMDEKQLLEKYAEQMKQGFSWIGFYEGKRAGFFILQVVSTKPIVFAVHGGVDPNLRRSKMAQKVCGFIKHFAFDQKMAAKIEGYIAAPNRLIVRFFDKCGMKKECEVKDRISIDGNLYPLQIYSITHDEYKVTNTKKTKKSKKKKRGSVPIL
jgi:RimJ/RimL family protein N-acetyltransferase